MAPETFTACFCAIAVRFIAINQNKLISFCIKAFVFCLYIHASFFDINKKKAVKRSAVQMIAWCIEKMTACKRIKKHASSQETWRVDIIC